MTLRNILLAGTALGAAVFMTAPAFAASNTQAELDALKAQIEALQRKIDDVEIHHGNAIKTLEERKSDVEVTLKNGRPEFKSASGAYSLAITGRAHLDTGMYDQDDRSKTVVGGMQGNVNFRRAILGVTGTLAKDFAYDLHFNFGDSGQEQNGIIYEAALHYKGIDGLTLSIGAIQPKLTLDDSTSSNDITFIERASAANLMTSFAAGDSRMAAGGTFNNDNFFAAGYYTTGKITNGGTGNDYDTSNAVGRVAFATDPAGSGANFHIGVSAAHAFNLPGDSVSFSDRPELRVSRTQLISTPAITNTDTVTAYGPELAFNYGPFRVQGEYYRYEIDRIGALADPEFDAWYLQASWIISGESYKYDIKKAAYSGVKAANPFTSVTGGFGAWEIAARYSTADLNDTGVGGGQQDIITVGLNWYANNNVRFMLDYLNADAKDYGGVAGNDFGHQAVGFRTQFAF